MPRPQTWAAPISSRTCRTPCRPHHVLRPSSTRDVDRGSANDAVPTSTADAPAIIISTASSPVAMPPTPTIGRSGSAACTLVDRAHRDRTDRRSRHPAATAAEDGTTGLDVDDHAHQGVDQRHGLGTALVRRPGRPRPHDRCWRSSFAHRGRPHADVAADHLPGGIGIVCEQVGAAVEVGTRQVHLDRHDLGGTRRQADRGARRSPRRVAPRCSRRPCSGREQGRQLARHARRRRRGPATRRC